MVPVIAPEASIVRSDDMFWRHCVMAKKQTSTLERYQRHNHRWRNWATLVASPNVLLHHAVPGLPPVFDGLIVDVSLPGDGEPFRLAR